MQGKKRGGERRGRLLLALGMAVAVSGCRVDGEDIEHWKGTVKGPGKLMAVLAADKYSLELRTQAALALVEMERPDRDGTADLQHAVADLPPETQPQLVEALLPGLEKLMSEGNPPGQPPTKAQIRAKDAAFLLISVAPDGLKDRLVSDVVRWYVSDFNGRSLAGNFSAEQVIRSLGSEAAEILVDGIGAKLPQQALVKLAQLIGQIADAPARREAAERLVAVEQEMRGQPFLGWIEDTIREQMKQTGRELDAPTLTRAAERARDSFLADGALPAMKWLASEAVVKRRLLEIAEREAGDDAATRRVKALQALEGAVDRGDLERVLALALDAKNPAPVRDYAFDRVGDIRSPDALPQLWPLVGSTKDGRLRWRAGELVLAIGGPSAIGELVQRLPGERSEYAPEELEGYASRMGQMAPLPKAQVRPLLTSSSWYARVIAIYFFSRKGDATDLKQLAAMARDSAKVVGKGWGKLDTVGAIAAEGAAAGTARLAAEAGAGI